ncbi:hypothetical protein AAFF_G00441790 [Aldrovandia affinis]|uniref:Ig-like domain-containing protein n=1 Tax=Aldrovandia affinis TaxID=143900 RepID=A0AAD7R2W9_9TELE|nr:hypothetical protein AAFF_G00441790 [Aldrovandia affinis]
MLGTLCTLITLLSCVSGVTVVTQKPPVLAFPLALLELSCSFCTGVYMICITVVFGQGTKLVVADSSLAAPSLSLLPPSSEELKTDKATLACLAQIAVGFADVSWTSNEGPVTDGVFTSSAKQQPDKSFGLSSFLTIKPSQWISGRVFSCKVSVGSTVTEKSITKSDCTVSCSLSSPHTPTLLISQLDKLSCSFCTGVYVICITVVFGQGTKLIVADSSLAAPSLSLLPPSSEELKTDKATLACLAQIAVGFADVSWTSNEGPVTDGVFTSSAKQQPDKSFGLSSFLTIKPSQWISGRVFSCKVSVGSTVTEKSISKSDCSE